MYDQRNEGSPVPDTAERGRTTPRWPKNGKSEAPAVTGETDDPNMDATFGAISFKTASYVRTVPGVADAANAEDTTSHNSARNRL